MIRKALPYPLDHGEDLIFDEHFQLCCVLVKFWGSKKIPELLNVLLENIPRFPISYELISLSEKRFITLRTFALIVSAHPYCARKAHATTCIERAR